jgi:hypothetical protein
MAKSRELPNDRLRQKLDRLAEQVVDDASKAVDDKLAAHQRIDALKVAGAWYTASRKSEPQAPVDQSAWSKYREAMFNGKGHDAETDEPAGRA